MHPANKARCRALRRQTVTLPPGMDERIHPFLGGGFFRLLLTEGGDAAVTYEGLFAFCLVLLGVAELIFQFYNKKK